MRRCLMREARVHEDGHIEVVLDCDDGFAVTVESDNDDGCTYNAPFCSPNPITEATGSSQGRQVM